MSMHLVTRLPAAPHTLLELDDARLALALDDGIGVVEDGHLRLVVRGAIDAAARGPDGCIYVSRGARLLRLDLDVGGDPEDVTADFEAAPRARRRIVCAADGEVWAEGCGARRRVGGTMIPTPSCAVEAVGPVPWAMDVHGNLWSLVDGAGGRQVLVLPASAPSAWQPAGLPAGPWEHLAADSVGYVWAGGADGWRRLCPRLLEIGWQSVDADLPAAVTAVGASPDARVLAAFATGQLLELDTDATGDPLARRLAVLPAAARCVHTTTDGAIWAATDDGLYRREAAAGAWQHTWIRRRGRLPGGGNHDVFAASCGEKIYVAGGWAGAWGLPPTQHVCDELFAFDRRSGYWEVASHMHIPRRYNGIAALEGRVWVVGGETRTVGREGEGQALYLVDIYDPASATWSAGPSLNDVRTDPFVVTCEGRIWAIGGAAHNAGPKLDTVESIGPGETAWRFETPLPAPTRQGHACVLGGVIYCCSIDGVFALDTRTGRWLEDMPQPGDIGQGPLAAAFGGEVWLLGGFGDRRCRRYDPAARTWQPGPDLPTEQAWGAAIVVAGELFVIGGAHAGTPHGAVLFDDRTYVLRPASSCVPTSSQIRSSSKRSAW